MQNHITKLFSAATLSAAILCSSISSYASPVRTLSITPELLKIQMAQSGLIATEISGYHWVNPYTRRDGTFVRGHMRGNPDGFCWNNLSGC